MNISIDGDGWDSTLRVFVVLGDTRKDITQSIGKIEHTFDVVSCVVDVRLTVVGDIPEIGAVSGDVITGERPFPIGCGLTPLPESSDGVP